MGWDGVGSGTMVAQMGGGLYHSHYDHSMCDRMGFNMGMGGMWAGSGVNGGMGMGQWWVGGA